MTYEWAWDDLNYKWYWEKRPFEKDYYWFSFLPGWGELTIELKIHHRKIIKKYNEKTISI